MVESEPGDPEGGSFDRQHPFPLESPRMNREYHRWYSPSTGREMEHLVFGHAGARVLVFPTSHGRFFEWEDREMVQAIAEPIERGWFQLFCVDSYNMESWYGRHLHPADRAARHQGFDHYLEHELVPFTRFRNDDPFLIATGASFGAYQAVNFGLRHPELVGRVLALHGIYDITRFTEGFSNDDVYFNNPCANLMHEHDPGRLSAIRAMDIILVTSQDDAGVGNNHYFSGLLWSKGIWHALRVWDGWTHDWPWWRRMVPMYIGGHD
jgi:esterase/lipase superfamily enzyme